MTPFSIALQQFALLLQPFGAPLAGIVRERGEVQTKYFFEGKPTA